MTIDASYELPADYRFAFFSISVLPVLITILIAGLLLIARTGSSDRKQSADSGNSYSGHYARWLMLSSLGLAAALIVFGIIVYLFSAQICRMRPLQDLFSITRKSLRQCPT
jgi:hypothetical protein